MSYAYPWATFSHIIHPVCFLSGRLINCRLEKEEISVHRYTETDGQTQSSPDVADVLQFTKNAELLQQEHHRYVTV
jgi:hypothetical protein